MSEQETGVLRWLGVDHLTDCHRAFPKKVIVDETWEMSFPGCFTYSQCVNKEKAAIIKRHSPNERLLLEGLGLKTEPSLISLGLYLLDFELFLRRSLPETLHIARKQTSYFLKALIGPRKGTGCSVEKSRGITIVNSPNPWLLGSMDPTRVTGRNASEICLQIFIGSRSAPLDGYVALNVEITSKVEMELLEVKVSLVEIIYLLKNAGSTSIADESRQLLFDRTGPPSKFPITTGKVDRPTEDLLQHSLSAANETGKGMEFQRNASPFDRLIDNPHEWYKVLEFSIRMPSCGVHNHSHHNAPMHFDVRNEDLEIKHRMEVSFFRFFPHVISRAKINQFRIKCTLCSECGRRYHRTLVDEIPFLLRSCHLNDSNILVPPYHLN